MKEEFLYYVWQFKRWKGNFVSTEGKTINVLFPGMLNKDSGPDFLNARIEIDDVLWVGNVEIHTKSSDWNLHKHNSDENYKNIILHVVYENDLPTNLGNFQTLELKNNISDELINSYKGFKKSFDFIPCENDFGKINPLIKKSFYESLFIERMSRKSDLWKNRLDLLNGDWEALLFETISYGFGLKINTEAFYQLSKSFDFKVVKEIQRKGENTESLLFGQAGFLESPIDEYQTRLKQEYDFLKHKYNLTPIDNHLFKFLRLRPANFPTIRLAQLSAMYGNNIYWFNLLIENNDYKTVVRELSKIQTSEYWVNHYVFGKESKSKDKKISKGFIDLLYINVIIPIKFLFYSEIGKDLDDLLDFVSEFKAENNSIINKFSNLDDLKLNMIDAQALLELKNNFCDEKKCLHCRVGNQILK